MARSLNRVDLLGWLGSDARIRVFDDGTSVGEVRVATEYSRKDASGEWHTATDWHTVRIQEARSAASVLLKGARVHLTGRLRTRSWEAEDGETRYRTEVACHARDVIVVSLPRDGDDAAGPVPEEAAGDDDAPY